MRQQVLQRAEIVQVYDIEILDVISYRRNHPRREEDTVVPGQVIADIAETPYLDAVDGFL